MTSHGVEKSVPFVPGIRLVIEDVQQAQVAVAHPRGDRRAKTAPPELTGQFAIRQEPDFPYNRRVEHQQPARRIAERERRLRMEVVAVGAMPRCIFKECAFGALELGEKADVGVPDCLPRRG